MRHADQCMQPLRIDRRPTTLNITSCDDRHGYRRLRYHNTGFDDPTTRPDATIRESIDMRAFAFY